MRAPRVCALLIVAAIAASDRRPARAGCATPPAFAFAPGDGSVLPPNPTIWVFLRDRFRQPRHPIDALIATDARGLPLRTAQTNLTTAGPYRAVALQIASAGGVVTVRARAGNQTRVARYTLRRMPARNALARTEIVAAKYVYASGCPSANGFVLAVAPKAPAYRVELGEETWIVPDQPSDFSRSRHGTIVTGGVYCYDFTIPTVAPLALYVTPLFPDGRRADTRLPYRHPTDPPPRCTTREDGARECTGGLSSGTMSWEVNGPVTATR